MIAMDMPIEYIFVIAWVLQPVSSFNYRIYITDCNDWSLYDLCVKYCDVWCCTVCNLYDRQLNRIICTVLRVLCLYYTWSDDGHVKPWWEEGHGLGERDRGYADTIRVDFTSNTPVYQRWRCCKRKICGDERNQDSAGGDIELCWSWDHAGEAKVGVATMVGFQDMCFLEVRPL